MAAKSKLVGRLICQTKTESSFEVERVRNKSRKDKRRRVVEQKSTFKTDAGDLVFRRRKTTTISEAGDIETVEQDFPQIIAGEKTTPQFIAGQCQTCRRLTTFRSVRFCVNCGLVTCVTCSRSLENEGEKRSVFCRRCFRSVRLKTIARTIFKIIFSPFIERTEK
jgi:hypothetical protein